ncbi:MAG: asparagine synthase (glutamine-hydrolyzing) [Acidobacteriota bacterium]
MCGICGILIFDHQQPVEQALIKRMNEIIKHRGPDDQGYYLNRNVALGHRRLSIIDLSGGHQPLANEDNSIWIIFNGEIYNHTELRKELTQRGHIFNTRSDTEVIVHAYEEYGDDSVKRLRGMFAFAIWDERRRRLVIARDRLGKKPLYYYHNNKFFLFASEIKSLLTHPEVHTEVEPIALNHYLSLRYVPGPLTMFKNIFKLQPGHLMIVDENGVEIRKYWELDFYERAIRPLREEVDEFHTLLKECVQIRLMSEVPLGVFLSGGVDSSAIVALMSELGIAKIKTFSVGYQGDDEISELKYARLVATHFNTEHYEFQVKPAEFQDFMQELVWYMDEPVADSSCIPLYFISRLARQYATVVLSGEGADELLAGYTIYQRMLTLEMLYKFYRPFATIVQPFWRQFLPTVKARKYLLLAGLPFEARYRGVSSALADDLKHELWSTSSYNGNTIAELFAPYYQMVQDAGRLNQMLFIDTKVWLPDDLLVKADKMTMANAQELRVPFLDHVLMEYAAGLPTSLKLRKGIRKFLLKEAMANLLPDEIISRPKRGFPTPLRRWFAEDLRTQMRAVLLAHNAIVRRYFKVDKIAELITEHETGRVDRNEELFTLLIFEYWHRCFLP